jgi:hypothetical protein
VVRGGEGRIGEGMVGWKGDLCGGHRRDDGATLRCQNDFRAASVTWPYCIATIAHTAVPILSYSVSFFSYILSFQVSLLPCGLI